jgi:exodeoxyribonuclease III
MPAQNDLSPHNFSLLCWNIGNPSRERAGKQAEWLRKRKESVFVLTETKRSEGCELIEKYLSLYGFNCVSSKPDSDYGVLIVGKSITTVGTFQQHFNFLPSRSVSAFVQTSAGEVEIGGMYVPSRDASPEKITRKQKYLASAADALLKGFQPTKRIFCGDLNILEPNHVPRYRFFGEWEYIFYNQILECGFHDAFRLIAPEVCEYSWVGRTGDGYRYDHCFISKDIKSNVVNCWYDHTPRESRLSDHSAMILEMKF